MQTLQAENLSAREKRILHDKFANFKGVARVAITHLNFPNPIRKVNRKIIEQLLRDFEGEGCRSEMQDHRIPAIIEDSVLQEALEKLSINTEAFKAKTSNPPILNLGVGVMLECLHGQHRILAATEYMPYTRWWTVDLYTHNLKNETKQALREGYTYSAKYSSGEIFRNIRLCHHDNDVLGVQRWKGRLTPAQDDLLEKLLKRDMLVESLDSVLHIQGLWREFYVGSLDVVLFLKCDEEISRYIGYVKLIWTRILAGDRMMLMNTDPSTIHMLQSRAPNLSKSDFDFIKEHSEELFPEVTDLLTRANVFDRLLGVEEIILSLYTMIKDIRYLKQPATILSTLLPRSPKSTLRKRYYKHFIGTESAGNALQIQQGVSNYQTIQAGHLDAFDVYYQEMWLCACRICKYPNAYGRRELVSLAQQLGFSSAKIQSELKKDPAQVEISRSIQDVLSILQPNEKFVFDASRARLVISSFQDYLNKSLTVPTKAKLPSISVHGQGEPISRRCGYSCMDTKDLNHLFLDKIHAPLNQYERNGDEISSFFVKRSRHIAFFGAIDLIGNHGDISYPVTLSPSLSTTVLSPYPTIVSSSITRQEIHEDPSSHIILSNHQAHDLNGRVENNMVVIHKEPMVKFIENGVLREIPLKKENVDSQAKEYADQGKKLRLEDGPYFIWHHCFDILTKTRKSTVFVSTVVESWSGKRRRGEELPEQLQPATKEAFDVGMIEEEEEEL